MAMNIGLSVMNLALAALNYAVGNMIVAILCGFSCGFCAAIAFAQHARGY